MIIARVPFRMSFFGGGTDFPGFFREHGGATLAATINQYAYLTVHRLSPFFGYRYRASYARTETVMDPRGFAHPLIRETLLHLGVDQGVEITHIADLPGQTGLGSSSSFTVGLLHALSAFRGRDVAKQWLAEQAVAVERDRVGDAGGWQDQYAVAFGGFNRIDFRRDGTVDVRAAACSEETKRELEEALLLFYLGNGQSASEILQRQISRTASNVPILLELLDIVRQAEDLLANGRVESFGRLLHEGWMRKRRLAEGITNGRIDEAYAAAREAGAWGGKLLGAGGRGFLCLAVPAHARAKVRERLKDLLEVPFRFENTGSRIVFRSDG
jgi:D-glycero-alpha-D-manno-heptose-7-phosphate kinase